MPVPIWWYGELIFTNTSVKASPIAEPGFVTKPTTLNDLDVVAVVASSCMLDLPVVVFTEVVAFCAAVKGALCPNAV